MACLFSCSVQPTLSRQIRLYGPRRRAFQSPGSAKLIQKKGYDILPTGADNSHQNGPVERGHCTLANMIWAILIGANLDIKIWPYAFYHALCMSNALPERNATQSPI